MGTRPPPTADEAEPSLVFELRLHPRTAGRPWRAELLHAAAASSQRFDSPLELMRYLEHAGEAVRRPGHLR